MLLLFWLLFSIDVGYSLSTLLCSCSCSLHLSENVFQDNDVASVLRFLLLVIVHNDIGVVAVAFVLFGCTVFLAMLCWA